MTTIREWFSRVWGTVRGNRRDAEMEEELKVHLEFATEDMQRRMGSRRTRSERLNCEPGASRQRWRRYGTNEACRGWQISRRTYVTGSG
jgi:hypothetical protein